MQIELIPGRLSVDPNHIVSWNVIGSYTEKQVVVQMTTGNEYVIGHHQNPDFSADKLYRQITMAKTEMLTLDISTLTMEEFQQLRWAVKQASEMGGVHDDPQDRLDYRESVGEAEVVLAKLKPKS